MGGVIAGDKSEEQPKKVRLSGNEIVVPIGHYEIKTFRVTF
jgi:hypothetical protein